MRSLQTLTRNRILLSAPRRSAAVPNADGTLALYTVATYSFESHKKTNEIRVLNLATGQSTLITNEEKTSEPNWLGDKTELFWLKEAEKGHTKLIAGDAGSVGNTQVIGTIPGPISNVKVKSLGNGKVALAVVGKSRPDGSLFNPGDEPQRNHTGLLCECFQDPSLPPPDALYRHDVCGTTRYMCRAGGYPSLKCLTTRLGVCPLIRQPRHTSPSKC